MPTSISQAMLASNASKLSTDVTDGLTKMLGHLDHSSQLPNARRGAARSTPLTNEIPRTAGALRGRTAAGHV